METVTLDINQLKEIINNTVRKAMKDERQQLIEALLPYVNNSEMDDIVTNYGESPKYEKFVDMTDWVKGED